MTLIYLFCLTNDEKKSICYKINCAFILFTLKYKFIMDSLYKKKTKGTSLVTE